MKKYIILFFIFIYTLTIISSEIKTDLSGDALKKFNEEKLSYIIKKDFDEMFPLDVLHFYFYKGNELINFQQFVSLTNDPLYYQNLELIKKTKIAGFTTAGVLGGCTIAFIIPSTILITNAVSYNLTEELKSNYLMSGVISSILAIATSVALIIDLIVTFSLIHKYENNEELYRKIIEKYNSNLKKSLLNPDLSIKNNSIDLSLKIKIYTQNL